MDYFCYLQLDMVLVCVAVFSSKQEKWVFAFLLQVLSKKSS